MLFVFVGCIVLEDDPFKGSVGCQIYNTGECNVSRFYVCLTDKNNIIIII